MASELEQQAKEAFVDDDFELAVDFCTQAIALNPKNANLFADRAQSYFKLHNFTEAVSDANKAIQLDPSMAKAYLRKGIACIKLEEYQTAKAALEFGASLAQNDARFSKLIKECNEHIAGLEQKAKEAFVDDDFELAVNFCTQAIALNPKNANLFADRAQSNIKLHNFTEAVSDANKAIELDPSMAKAYLRKGTACIKLEEYQTAKAALEFGASLAQNDARFTKLIKECNERIAEETQHLAPKEPECMAPAPVGPQSFKKTVPQIAETGQDALLQMNQLTLVKPKYRHEYYQKPEEVILTIFAKGIAAKHVVVDFGEQILSITVDVRGENSYHFQPRLFGKIIPDKCRYEVLSTKIEIRLAKAETINWTSLEFSKEITVAQKLNVASVGSHRPTYPSSKSRARDWDKLEAMVKEEEKEEKLDGDAAANKLFRDIYQNADEDMRRAMSKSYVESNGTVLSTNWSDVGSKKVEGSTPDGMELKKWEL